MGRLSHLFRQIAHEQLHLRFAPRLNLLEVPLERIDLLLPVLNGGVEGHHDAVDLGLVPRAQIRLLLLGFAGGEERIDLLQVEEKAC